MLHPSSTPTSSMFIHQNHPDVMFLAEPPETNCKSGSVVVNPGHRLIMSRILSANLKNHPSPL